MRGIAYSGGGRFIETQPTLTCVPALIPPARYERHAIEAWLATNGTSPMTGASLTDTRLLPNHTLAAALRAALGEHACTGRKQQ